MIYLVLASVLWSFSFGLINRQLVGLDPAFTAFARLLVATLCCLPFLRWRALPVRLRGALAATGVVQYGLMYLFYMRAFVYLEGHEIALLTVTTPLLVVLIDDARHRRVSGLNLAAALLATLGCVYLRVEGRLTMPALQGIVLVQLANGCFALGQVAYRELLGPVAPTDASAAQWRRDVAVSGLLYGGAALVAGAAAVTTGGIADLWRLSWTQTAALLYLGTIPAGLAFLLWNMGARRVRGGVLACMNNLKIPLAVAVAVIVFGETAAWPRVAVAFAALSLAVWAVRRH